MVRRPHEWPRHDLMESHRLHLRGVPCEFFRRYAEHSALGHANTLRGVQLRRPSIYSLEKQLARLKVPLHCFAGDEDDISLDVGVFIKRACPAARLTVAPASGHLVSVEEPDFFNRMAGDFLTLVDSGRWRPRDPRSLAGKA